METIPQSALDTIIATKARDMYRDEYLKMAVELKSLRARFDKREDMLIIDSDSDLPADRAAGWGNGLRSIMQSMTPGQVRIIPGIGKRWLITMEKTSP